VRRRWINRRTTEEHQMKVKWIAIAAASVIGVGVVAGFGGCTLA